MSVLPVDTTPVMTYEKILMVLREELVKYDTKIWSPQIGVRRIRALQAERERLLADIKIIEDLAALHPDFHGARTKAPVLAKVTKPTSAYGEP